MFSAGTNAWGSVQPTFGDYMHLNTWRWYFHGKPPTPQFIRRALDREQQALIRLGYFEQRYVLVQHPNNVAQGFAHAASRHNSSFEDHHWVIQWDQGHSRAHIIAHPHDVPILERLIKEVDDTSNQ